MNIFFSISTDLYNSALESEYIKFVEIIFPENTIIIPSDYMPQINEVTNGMKKRDREKYISNFFFHKIGQCDIFIYTNTYSKDGNILFTRGVRGEINKAFELKKTIYRLYLDDDPKRNPIKLQKMDITYFDTIIKSYNYNTDKWILKSTKDYIRFYDNNPEAIKLISSQFEGKIGKYIAIPHFNYVREIEKYGTNKFRGCKKHSNDRHSIILPKQEFTKICPYTDDKWIWADYSTVKLKTFPLELNGTGGIKDLLSMTRTLHKLMLILKEKDDDSCNYDYSKEGLAYVNEEGKIPFERGKPIKDYRKIAGVRPLFDIDIKDEYKQTDSFFEPEIFNEYQKTIDLFFEYYDNDDGGIDKNVRGIFSGNGLYIDLGEKTFYEFDCNGFLEFDSEWSSIRKTMQEIMEENGIKRLRIERGYGWQRYFKVAFTFHAKSERISIPLNINESLDKKWIKEVTDIKLGLEQNVSKEIMKRSGNNWR